MSQPRSDAHPQDSTIIGTIQSLVVAFVLAMIFRGFVTEGFVIPTGSMAPTLLGQHKRLHSEHTGFDFAVGVDPREAGRDLGPRLSRVSDPMLGRQHPGTGTSRHESRVRMGDRILVLKCLYPFSRPSRFDVVVFKNQTNPNGADGNYIKRLVGLPGESVWLVDGDVFVAPADRRNDYDQYVIQRKPAYIQRAVWQPVHLSDYYPIDPGRLDSPYAGAPWQGDHWQTEGRSDYRCDTGEATTLTWENHIRQLDDWPSYNMLSRGSHRDGNVYVHDVRVAAALLPDEEGLHVRFELEARDSVYEFTIGGSQAVVRMRSREDAEAGDEGWEGPPQPFDVDPIPPGRATSVEFWHVDQSMSIFVDGERVAYYEYDWHPEERLANAVGYRGDLSEMARRNQADPPVLRWRFSGSPLTLHRVGVSRDLYYRTDVLNDLHTQRNPTPPQFESLVGSRYAFGTHPGNPAVLGDDQFFMLGDNSTASSDSRLWGNPHPIVAQQVDPKPFVVNRRLLLGKAWVVYYPAPYSLTPGGTGVIPDFGRLRFIR